MFLAFALSPAVLQDLYIENFICLHFCHHMLLAFAATCLAVHLCLSPVDEPPVATCTCTSGISQPHRLHKVLKWASLVLLLNVYVLGLWTCDGPCGPDGLGVQRLLAEDEGRKSCRMWTRQGAVTEPSPRREPTTPHCPVSCRAHTVRKTWKS